MENIIRKTVTVCFLIMAMIISAQNQAIWQQVFYKSYEAEKTGKYTIAINELKKVYKTDNYFVNIRMGWLHYLSRQHAEAEKYYLNALNLNEGLPVHVVPSKLRSFDTALAA